MRHSVLCAMNSHARSSARVVREQGVIVTDGTPSTRYGMAGGQPSSRRSLYLHLPSRLSVAWLPPGGHRDRSYPGLDEIVRTYCMVGVGATWRCGKWSNHAWFTDDASAANTQLCHLCIEHEAREKAAAKVAALLEIVSGGVAWMR